MSYEPEIFISCDRDVLEEIRNPFTNAVCWDARGDDECMALVENARRVDDLTRDMPAMGVKFKMVVV